MLPPVVISATGKGRGMSSYKPVMFVGSQKVYLDWNDTTLSAHINKEK